MKSPIPAAELRATLENLFQASGMELQVATAVADVLTEAELMERRSHGVQLLDWYLRDVQSGLMAKSGKPVVHVDNEMAVVWEGRSLPGAWVMKCAFTRALERSLLYPVITMTISESHHLGCHGAYLRWATEHGLIMILMDTNPGFRSVAPFGGKDALYSPTPVGFGLPTTGNPILVDISLSSTSLLHAREYWKANERLPGRWLLDQDGCATDDPSVLFGSPKGSILPLGGDLLGHKGFGLALLAYALSAGLGGCGSRPSDGNGSAVFLQIINPELFAGASTFCSEMSAFADACRGNRDGGRKRA